MMTLDEQLLTEARGVRERLLDLQHDVDRARVDYQHAIRRLHAAGGSMREIAEVLGLSHQRVHQIVDAGPEDARTGRGGPRRRTSGRFARFSRYARAAVERAQVEADDLGHSYLGTEHLLLGLARVESGGAASALDSLGLRYDPLRGAVVEAVGQPAATRRRGRLPLTAKLKSALQLAVTAAEERGARWVGTEDLLVGLAAERSGLAAELLTSAGADEAAVRSAVERVLGR